LQLALFVNNRPSDMRFLLKSFAISPILAATVALSACGTQNHATTAVLSASIGQPLYQSMAISKIGWSESPVQVSWTFNSTADVNFTIQSCDQQSSCNDIAVLSCIGQAQCSVTDATSDAVIPGASVTLTTQNGIRSYTFVDNDMQAFSSDGSRSGSVRLSAIGLI
jgi:hypothetical protein